MMIKIDEEIRMQVHETEINEITYVIFCGVEGFIDKMLKRVIENSIKKNPPIMFEDKRTVISRRKKYEITINKIDVDAYCEILKDKEEEGDNKIKLDSLKELQEIKEKMKTEYFGVMW